MNGFVCLIALKIVYQLSNRAAPIPWEPPLSVACPALSHALCFTSPYPVLTGPCFPSPAAQSLFEALQFCARNAVIFLSLSDATLFPLGFTCKPISNKSVRYLLCVSKMLLFFFFFCKLTKVLLWMMRQNLPS